MSTDVELQRRIREIRRKMEKFHIRQVDLVNESGVIKSTFSKVLSLEGKDPRYLTDANVKRVEDALNSLLKKLARDIEQEMKQKA